MEKENFEQRIDIIKALGTILIIVAHTITSTFINQLRVFDVPLLIIVSGILAEQSYKREKNYLSYLKKRIIRLLIPTYLFFTIFFLVTLIGSKIINTEFPFSILEIRNTYLLLDGVGYVWIIRIYLLTAIVTPLLLMLKEKIHMLMQITILVLMYIIYEVVFYNVGNAHAVLTYIIYYILPYSTLIWLGLNIKENKKLVKGTAIFFTVVFLITTIILTLNNNGIIPLISSCKYPPRIYFLSYSIAMSMLLILLVNKIRISKDNVVMKLIVFISRHSMWIYLWHILFVFIAEWTNMQNIVKFLFVLTMTILITFLQNKFTDIVFKTKKNIFTKVLKG